MSASRDFIIGVAVGSAVGAAAALLYAPQSGAETRGIIKDRAGEARDKTMELAEAGRTRAGEMVGQTKDKAGELIGQAQSQLRTMTDSVKAKADSVIDQGQEMVTSAKELAERQQDAVKSAVAAGKQAFDEKQKELKDSTGNAEGSSHATAGAA